MTKRARIIYNPTSGRELIQKSLVEVLKIYENQGFETSTFSTTAEPLSAQKEAQRCAEDGFELIVAAGGDGTINEVINGIAPLKNRPKVAVLPAGTTNDLARALQIPKDLVQAAKVIEGNETIRMDVGRADFQDTCKYFINIAAAGSLTELTYEVSPELKSIFGPLAYFVKGAEMLPTTKAMDLCIDFEDREFNDKATLLFISLTNSVGGFEKLAMDTVYGDGLFTVIVLKEVAAVEIVNIIRQIMTNGAHTNHPKIIYKKMSKLNVYSADGPRVSINLDGEYGGQMPVTFVALKQHIEFVVDPKKLRLAKEPKEEEQ